MNYYILRYNPFTDYAHPADTYDVIPANPLIPEKYWFGGFTGNRDRCLDGIKRCSISDIPVYEACAMPLPGNNYHLRRMKERGLWK